MDRAKDAAVYPKLTDLICVECQCIGQTRADCYSANKIVLHRKPVGLRGCAIKHVNRDRLPFCDLHNRQGVDEWNALPFIPS